MAYLNRRLKWQTAFNAVVKHARQMKERCMVDGQCKYRREDGNRCFVGALIPNNKYDPKFDEGSGLRFDLITGPMNASHLNPLLSTLQTIHDYDHMDTWEARFKIVANSYGLVYTEPTHA